MVELDLRLGHVLEGEPRELEPRLRRSRRPLVTRILDDEDEQAVEPEVVDGRPREPNVADVRRVEGASEDP
jgi:hypothetical protein